ncbi:MAG: hypothetical protein A3K77_05440 [Euryarchaeota archaeon RBG_13_31_8]|nr:MAG: hypothetical protein A3K77_05440 [Euryarchaeota archaeon RBG_13_31_8]
MKNISENKNRIKIGILLIAIGSIVRIMLHNNLPSPPLIYITINGLTQPMFMFDLFFVVAIISIISGIILGGYYTFIIPISTMIISDIVIGNNWIILFTWSGFVILGLIGYFLKSKNKVSVKHIPGVLGLGIGGILLYDLWTNFGTWLGGWGYTYTWAGLTLCYTKALPFMLWHLLSTTIAMIIVLVPIIYLKEHKVTIPDFNITQIEKRITIAAPVLLMVLAVLSLIV